MSLLSSMLVALSLFASFVILPTHASNSTYSNPVLPGWHSDPSCVQVDGTFYCVTSTFIAFPGLPIYASKDLLNWKLISHVWNRESQMPGVSQQTKGQQEGFFAATIRYHDEKFWVACEYLGVPGGMIGTVFTTSDPYNETGWSDPITFITPVIDLDLFWDDDGKLYIPGQGAILLDVDLESGQVINSTDLWSGTGGVAPEGPHIYRKDGYYYLSLAEGGTETGHSQVLARSSNLTGPYTPCPHNPILTNRDTDEYFQTVGHADLFQDKDDNWWGMALATRSGPAWEIYPMGRETVLFPVTWNEGEWPILEPVRGRMSGWSLPSEDKNIGGKGPFNSDPDIYNFPEGSDIPGNLMYWRVPPKGAFSVGSEGGLRISPSRANLTGDNEELDGTQGISFIGRPQTHSMFQFRVTIDAKLQNPNEEVGVTVFLTQYNHADLGIVARAGMNGTKATERVLRFRTTGGDASTENVVENPKAWGDDPIMFEILTANLTHYSMKASPASQPFDQIQVGIFSARLVSGQSGPFTGSLIGAYATCNGAGQGLDCPTGSEIYVRDWSYFGLGQYRGEDLLS